MGLYTIKHTDGNIMPILDNIVECKPHAIHFLDPQAKVDIKTVKELVGIRSVCAEMSTVPLCRQVPKKRLFKVRSMR